MANSNFQEGKLNREPRKAEPVKKFEHGKKETITREPLLKRHVANKEHEDTYEKHDGYSKIKIVHVHHHHYVRKGGK